MCPADLYNELVDIARAHGSSLEFVLRDALEEYVREWYEFEAKCSAENGTTTAMQFSLDC